MPLNDTLLTWSTGNSFSGLRDSCGEIPYSILLSIYVTYVPGAGLCVQQMELCEIPRYHAGIAVFGSCGTMLKRVTVAFFPEEERQSGHAVRVAAEIF